MHIINNHGLVLEDMIISGISFCIGRFRIICCVWYVAWFSSSINIVEIVYITMKLYMKLFHMLSKFHIVDWKSQETSEE